LHVLTLKARVTNLQSANDVTELWPTGEKHYSHRQLNGTRGTFDSVVTGISGYMVSLHQSCS